MEEAQDAEIELKPSQDDSPKKKRLTKRQEKIQISRAKEDALKE